MLWRNAPGGCINGPRFLRRNPTGGWVAVNHMFENRKAQAQCNLMTERLILLIWSLDLILRKEDAPKTDPEQTR